MKAIVFTKYGEPDVLRYLDMPDPRAGTGEIVVDMHAASINGVDVKLRSGGSTYKAHFPHILGRDFSGVVSEVGADVSDLTIGDAVFGVLDRGIDGTYAEKILTRADITVKKPEWLSHAEATAVALTGITATWALEDTAKIQAGETILVHGGAGGVGSFAIQLARHLGATVIATASMVNREYVSRLGAHQVIDYSTQDFTKFSPACDVVFDTVGGETQIKSYEVLKSGGRLVWIVSAPQGFIPSRHDVRSERPDVRRDRVHLQRVLDLLEGGAISPPPIQTFDLKDSFVAHRVAEKKHVQGKLVLTTMG